MVCQILKIQDLAIQDFANVLRIFENHSRFGNSVLKGHCHAIWQLSKKLGGLLKSPAATDGMNENGLKLGKNGQLFRVLMLRVPKILKKYIMFSPL